MESLEIKTINEQLLEAAAKRRAFVLAEYNSGKSISQIGREMGLARQQVHHILKKAGYVSRRKFIKLDKPIVDGAEPEKVEE